ncbi:MAG: gliding motility-associated C-terminal domain-containing protein [Saprospiraceae bacterium]|nr:gliding motility-associated C-terminal domain-containing protein [Saprospiraceae bacterium]
MMIFIMNAKRNIAPLLIIYLLIFSTNIKSQGCAEYSEIEGPECFSCLPEGWEATSSTPDLLDPTSGTLCSLSESPSGGTAIHLFSNGSTDIEGIITTITIDDFVEGAQYYISFFVAQCNQSADIEITIDGEDYTISPSDDWEAFELCITPSSNEFDFFITVADYEGFAISNTYIDTGICDPEFCCLLKTELVEGPIEICPDDPFVIESDYEDEVGSVEVEWTSDPSHGVNFLNDPFDINPTFLVPFDEDYEGETFLLTYRVEDDECFLEKEVEIEVGPSLVPEFEIYLCEIYEDQELPNVSFDPFTGSWEGDFNFDALGGTTQEYTFTLDPGQENCLESWTYEYEIALEEIVTFDFKTVYCVTDNRRYEFPKDSEDNIEGDWDDQRFRPSDLGIGFHTFIFTPDIYTECALPYEMIIEVTNPDTANFNIPFETCSKNDSLFLPPTSIEGFTGIWDIQFIDLDSIGIYEATFTPTDVNACVLPTTITLSVLSNVENTFSIPDTVCRGQGLIILDTLSNQGNLGFWNPSSFLLDTISEKMISATWTPYDTSCSSQVIFNITIEENIIPIFNLENQLCRNAKAFTLPSISENFVEGSWSIPIIPTDDINVTQINSVFIPSNPCVETYDQTFSIVDEIIPEFSFETSLCSGENIFDLPLTSDNGISGNWSIGTIDPATVNGQLTTTFNPDENPNLCAQSVDYTFEIGSLIAPTFNLPDRFCYDETYTFPITSDNNIQGTWTNQEFTFVNGLDDSFMNTFTPDNLDCHLPIDISIPIFNFEDIDISTINTSSCLSNDGSISILNGDNGMQYSIDDQNTWQDEAIFNNLTSGNYTLYVTYSNSNCGTSFLVDIWSPASANILSLEVQNVEDCTEINGSVICEATGSNLEFSIDDGISWQSDNSFENLSSGSYKIKVRSDGSDDCFDELEFEVDAFPQTILLDIIKTDPSGCFTDDGAIEIVAEGQNLEYSINGGLDFQASAIFNNLLPDLYEIIVRSQDASDCFETSESTIDKNNLPIINNIILTHISDCNANDGVIEILAEGQELEYSIDNGLTWVDNNSFTNMNGGIYTIQVREKNMPDCYTETDTELLTPQDIQIINVDTMDPSDCLADDGWLRLQVSHTDIEFSIDQGINWQDDNQFTNLSASTYIMLARLKFSPSCVTSVEAVINASPCPCNTLNFDYSITPVTCSDPNSGTITIENIEGFFTNENYNLIWDNGSDQLTIENVGEGWQSFEIYHDLNCIYVDSIYVDAIDPLTFGLLSFDQDCKNLGSIEVTELDGGSGQLQISIDGINYQESNLFYNLTAEEYTIFVQDIFDCEEDESVVVDDNSNLTLNLPTIPTINQGESTFLNPLINVATIDSFTWSPQTGILNPAELIAEVSPTETTVYTLTIYFGQCTETRSVLVEVIENKGIFIPNTFSPNGDGNNDTFFIQGSSESDIIINALRIYDRWGNLVFKNQNFPINEPSQGWDGHYENSKINPGVYVYLINYTVNGQILSDNGNITIVR